MVDINDYLEIDKKIAELDWGDPPPREVRLKTRILKCDRNDFYFGDEKDIQHYRLEIYWEERWSEEEADSPEDREWRENREQQPYPLGFYWSGDHEPSIQEFSEHVKTQCRAMLLALTHGLIGNSKEAAIRSCPERDETHPEHVFEFKKALGEPCEKTADFLKDYWDWHDRLYQTQKWFSYLLGFRGSCYGRWDYPVGDRILEFVDLENAEAELV